MSSFVPILVIVDLLLLCVLISLIKKTYDSRKNSASGVPQRVRVKAQTYGLLLTAMFIGFALVLKFMLSFSIPLFGTDGMKVGFSGIFTAFPAFLFGPLYGGIASAISDVMGFFFKPTGPYAWQFTVMAFIGGVTKGLVWMLLKNIKKHNLKIIFAVIFLAVGVFGASNHIQLRNDGVVSSLIAVKADMPVKEEMAALTEGEDCSFATELAGKLVQNKGAKSYQSSLALYINLLTGGLMLAGFLSLAYIGIDAFVITRYRKKRGKEDSDYFKILLAILASGIIVTSINTQVLIDLYSISLPYILYWIPRVIEEIIVCIIQAYFISILYGVYKSRLASRFDSQLR